MATIDNLQISIEATDRASSKIESLAHALSSLKSNVPSRTALNNVANGVRTIADSVNAIDGRTMTSASNKIQKLGDALASFRSVPNGNNLRNVGAGVRSITDALAGIDGRRITSVQSKLIQLGTALNTFPRSVANLTNVANGIIDISTAVDSISEDSIRRIERLGTALQGFRGINMRQIRNLSNNAGNEAPRNSQQVENEESRVGIFQRLSNALTDTAGRFRVLQRVARFAGGAIEVAGRTARLAWNALGGVLGLIRRGFNSLTAPLRTILRSIGRIAFYRALRTIIKEIAKGIKEGIQNLAQFSKLMNELDTHGANRVMSLYASNLLYFKNAVATAVIPILKMLEPIFDSVINKAVEFTNVLAQVFSFLSGSSTYTRAKYYYIDYAESLDKASGSAGKLNKQLAQFDELNNLTTSSGSGSDNALDYLKMFEDPVPIEDWVKNLENQDWGDFGQKIADKIKNSLDNIDWDTIHQKAREFGNNFASFLNGLFDPEMFDSVGSTIANSLNTAIYTALGFGEKFDGIKFGTGIANGINAFFRDFDFTALGLTIRTWATKLGDVIKSAIKHIHWDDVGSGVKEFVDGLFGGEDGFDSWLKEYDPAFYEASHRTASQNMIKEADDFETSWKEYWADFVDFWKDPWQAVTGKTIGEWLKDWAVNAILGANNIYETINNKIENIYDILLNKLFGVRQTSSSFDNVPDYVKKELGLSDNYSLFDESVKLKFQKIGENIIDGIKQGMTRQIAKFGAGSWSVNLFNKVYDTICFVFGIASPAKKMYPIGENIVLGIIEGFYLVNIVGKLTQWFDEKVKPVFSENKWRSAGDNAKKGLSNVFSYGNFYNVGETAGKALYTAFNTQLNNLYDAFKKIKAQIEGSPIVQSVTTNVTTVVSSVQSVADTALDIAKKANLENLSNIPNTTPTNTSGNNYTKTPTVNTIPDKLKLPEAPSAPSYIQDYSAREQWRKNWIENWKKQNPAKSYYANGGFPTMGSMFIAGERGAELVGNINGRTGVANTLQIEDAMYQAVYDATSRALSENEMSVTIEGDMDKVFRVMQNKSQSFYTRTGRPAF